MNQSLKQNAKAIVKTNNLGWKTVLYFIILIFGSIISNIIPIIGAIIFSSFMGLVAIGVTYQLSNNQPMDIGAVAKKFGKYICTYLWYLLAFWPTYLVAFSGSMIGGLMIALSMGSEGIVFSSIGIFIMLASYIFIIYYSIKLGFEYAVAYYIVVDDSGSDLSAKDCLKTSKAMMMGHKKELFLLMLSFIGWLFAIPFTFGILGFWVLPYYQVTLANFYNYVKADYMNQNRYNY